MDLISQQNGFTYSLDWSFGPFLLRREYVQSWTEYKGQTYDSQWGPMISLFRSNPSIRIGTPFVDYLHSEKMKAEEEGNLEHALRRLNQLQDCVASHRMAWES